MTLSAHHDWVRMHWARVRGHRVPGLLGKAPATDFGAANVTLAAVQAAGLPPAPKRFGYARMFRDWGMLGNDRVGDCAFAGSAHEHMIWTGIPSGGKHAARFTTQGVLGAYSSLTGYRPSDPTSDRGTNVSQLMDFRRTVGVPDETGFAHKIDLGVRLEPVGGPFDWDQFVRAISAFKAVAVGTLMPSSAQQQFALHEPWDYVGDRNIEGGHYIPAVASANSDNQVTVITWGRAQVMTRSFFEAYVDELWVPLCREAQTPILTALSAVDWDKVEDVARGLGEADA